MHGMLTPVCIYSRIQTGNRAHSRTSGISSACQAIKPMSSPASVPHSKRAAPESIDRHALVHVPDARHPEWAQDITHVRPYMPASFDHFDPDTELGQMFPFYSERKWQIMERSESNKNLTFRLLKRPQESRLDAGAGLRAVALISRT